MVQHNAAKPAVAPVPMARLPKGSYRGLIIAMILCLCGFLAYLAVPGSCREPTQYIHISSLAPQAVGGTAAEVDAGSGTWQEQQQQGKQQQGKAGGGSSSSCSDTAAAAPPPTTLQSDDLQALGSLLPATNFSSIKVADLLDRAAAAKLNHRAVRGLMQLYSKMFCSSGMHKADLPGSTTVQFGNVSLYVYDTADIVSNQLRSTAHTWEATETEEFLWAIKQFQATRQLQLKQGAAAAAAVPSVPLVVDIGANIGWFTLNAAAAKCRVAAFEGMESNLALIRRSMCSSPWLEERIALYDTGLGAAAATCYVISDITNKGDGITTCGNSTEEAYRQASSTPGYEVRGEMSLRRLDSLLAEDVQVMKMDVEGFESQVLEGATDLISNHNVWYIMTECNVGMIGEAKAKAFVRLLDSLGYATSPLSFRGPFWSEADIESGAATCLGMNLYCVKKSLPH